MFLFSKPFKKTDKVQEQKNRMWVAVFNNLIDFKIELEFYSDTSFGFFQSCFFNGGRWTSCFFNGGRWTSCSFNGGRWTSCWFIGSTWTSCYFNCWTRSSRFNSRKLYSTLTQKFISTMICHFTLNWNEILKDSLLKMLFFPQFLPLKASP